MRARDARPQNNMVRLPAGSIKKGFSFLNIFVIAIDDDPVGIGQPVPVSIRSRINLPPRRFFFVDKTIAITTKINAGIRRNLRCPPLRAKRTPFVLSS
jgi:hypothetical protein